MNGKHSKLCQCSQCVAVRFDRFVESVEGFYKKFHTRPNNPEQTVMVGEYTVHAHFRRNPHHMNHDPKVRERAEAYLARMRRRR